MWIMYLLMLPFAVGICFYFKAFLKRMLESFGADVSKKYINTLLWTASVCIGLVSLNLLRFGAVIVLHVLVISAVFQFVNFIIKKWAGDKYTKGFCVWKRIYGSGMIPLILTAVLLVTGYFNMHSIVRTDYTVYTEKDVGDGYRVVLVADVHYGVSIEEEELLEKCSEISALYADMVILCGDIVDSGTDLKGMKTAFNAFGNINSKHGVFYVYGNHDRAHNHGGAFTDAELEKAISDSGIRILKDEVLDIDDKLTLIGREDRGYTIGQSKRKSIYELTEGIDKGRFILTLDHQPTEYEENGNAGTDLLLSGHTHAGQLWPMNHIFNIFGINDGVYGKIAIDKDTDAIVTSGFAGWSYPVKTAAPAEYVVIEIKN